MKELGGERCSCVSPYCTWVPFVPLVHCSVIQLNYPLCKPINTIEKTTSKAFYEAHANSIPVPKTMYPPCNFPNHPHHLNNLPNPVDLRFSPPKPCPLIPKYSTTSPSPYLSQLRVPNPAILARTPLISPGVSSRKA